MKALWAVDPPPVIPPTGAAPQILSASALRAPLTPASASVKTPSTLGSTVSVTTAAKPG